MSTVSGPTPMSSNTSTSTPAGKPINMSSSSVLTETATARTNGISHPASAPDENIPSAPDILSNTNTIIEPKEEPRTGSSSPSDAALPADLKRILAEVARTGSCSWLPWNRSSHGAPPASAPADSPTEVEKAVAAVGKTPPFALTQQSRRPYSNRLSTIAPPRKKHKGKNGLKVRGQHGQSRKRPLFLIRTSASQGGSVGSGRTSGSEPDDSTQYECDSEGTSATSCSELSTERNHLRNMQRVVTVVAPNQKLPAVNSAVDSGASQEYHSLKDVFRMALGMVLDHWYRHRGGYKLSPAERRRSEAEKANANSASSSAAMRNGEYNSTTTKHNTKNPRSESNTNGTKAACEMKSKKTKEPPKAEDIFQKRKQRLLVMLGQPGENGSKTSRRNPSAPRRFQGEDEGPPFTIQRIAEVLIAPERYYTQTHKLCNCLEKLLLVTSSTSAFGGSTGGVTSQSRLEERELAALADEKGRLEIEFRQRALKRRNSISDDLQIDGAADAAARALGSPCRDDGPGTDAKSNSPSPEKKADGDPESSSREMLEAAARSLRTKFDHVGIDPHSSAVANRDVRSIAENRGMTNSPPPPSLAMSAAAASNIALPGHSAVGNFVRQHHPEQNSEHASIARVPSPILFSQNHDSPNIAPLHAPPNINLLHMHHAAPLAGVTPFDVVTIDASGGGASAPTSTNLPGSNEGADLEGRSSASNSDVDSESDDVSFDDSASDRSDGSDSGHYEPFTAARAMALSRIQQQQRLNQNRGAVLTSLALHQSEGGSRPPADSEYQSGDSIDSTRGEDSGGSDSSSSDLAD